EATMTDNFESDRPDSMQALIVSITPEIYLNLKSAVEIGRWPNGERLTQAQLEHSMQAIIGWELTHLPEEQRTGYIDTTGLKQSHCDTPDHTHNSEVPVNWVDNGKHNTH